jgi:hypothetical protein
MNLLQAFVAAAISAGLSLFWYRRGFLRGVEAERAKTTKGLRLAFAEGRKKERSAIAQGLAVSEVGALRVVGEAMIKDGWVE